MTNLLSNKIISSQLSNLGLKKGDTVFVFSNLVALGPVKNVSNKIEFCETYYNAIRDVIGDDGTLVVPTYTSQVGREGINFILEETPCLTGIFSEHKWINTFS